MKTLGIDWGHKELCLALADERGDWITVERHATHAVPLLLARLLDLGGPRCIEICIESGAPLLRDTLRAHGYDVAEIVPALAAKLGQLHAPGGAKDDARDARALAMARRHQQLGLTIHHDRDDVADELRLASATRERLVRQRTRLMQQTIGLLRSAHPGLAALGLDLRTVCARRLIAAYPHPHAARRARRAKVERLLRRARRKDLATDRVLESLRQHGHVIPDHVARACARELPLLIEQLDLLERQLERVERDVEQMLAEHPDTEIFASLPGVGPALTATIASRLNGRVARCHDAKQIQILAGTAPRTRVSGKRSGGRVSRRIARDTSLHQALVIMARCSLAKSAWARDFVRHHTAGRLRDQKRLNRAYRALANKWVRIIHHLLATRSTYDEATHCETLRRNAVPWAPDAQNRAA